VKTIAQLIESDSIEDSCADLLESDDPNIRAFAELLIQVMPIVDRWCRERISLGTTIGMQIDQAAAVATSVATTMIANWVPRHAFRLALLDLRSEINSRLDEADILARQASN